MWMDVAYHALLREKKFGVGRFNKACRMEDLSVAQFNLVGQSIAKPVLWDF